MTEYHILPKDDPEAVVNILRQAAGLPPLKTEEAESENSIT